MMESSSSLAGTSILDDSPKLCDVGENLDDIRTEQNNGISLVEKGKSPIRCSPSPGTPTLEKKKPDSAVVVPQANSALPQLNPDNDHSTETPLESSPYEVLDRENVTKKCSVKLFHLNLKIPPCPLAMESEAASSSSSVPSSNVVNNGCREVSKRDNETVNDEGPIVKKSKPDEVIVLDAEKEAEKLAANPAPEITVIKLKSPPKEVSLTSPCLEKKSEARSPGEVKSRTTTPDKFSPIKVATLESAKKSSDYTVVKSSKSVTPGSTMDRTDRTSLQCLEQKLKDLQQQHQQKSKSHESISKPKSMSPSGLKSSKDNYHRRTEAFIMERKKQSSSPVKKSAKKPTSTPPPHKENKLGGLFCPTTDAKVTILPCKSNIKENDLRPSSSSSTSSSSTVGSNSVTITKLSSGDSLSIPAKDIKKVFKSEMKGKVLPGLPCKSDKFLLKPFTKTEKHKTPGDKMERLHKDQRSKDREFGGSREASRDGRDKPTEKRERVGSLKIIRCSKCREVFSTKEAKKLHTCNSILDAHYLIDGGDRQKTSPTSSASNSDRSESTSTSLSRSSSRSSSPGIPLSNVKKSGDNGTAKPKSAKRLDEEKLSKVKLSLKSSLEEEEKFKEKKFDKGLVKRDLMKEKWVENKGSLRPDCEGSELAINSYPSESLQSRTSGLVIEAVKTSSLSDNLKKLKHPTAVEIVKMEKDYKKELKEDGSAGDPSLFSFSGKRTYSPSMSENTVDGKESPRESNSKDSPASQADSGVFSIASSASPSKVDGVINSDVRSPDSPRSMEHTLKPDQSQWKLGINTSAPTSTDSKSNMSGAGGVRGIAPLGGSEQGLPQGINLPMSTSITRVLPQTSSPYPINSNNGLHSKIPLNMMGGGPWQPPPMMGWMDELSKKKRGRPRKNGDPIFSGKIKNNKPKSAMEDDKDMYDFETEEDETKPVQPLRPRRQNTHPVTYKDPDSDEDAKLRQPQIPLIQSTQGYKEVHVKAQTLGAESMGLEGETLQQQHAFLSNPPEDQETTEEHDEEKEKNISYTCSKIEETPKGGIKLKIKIKKSASPAPPDMEPPLKKVKTESDESGSLSKDEDDMEPSYGSNSRNDENGTTNSLVQKEAATGVRVDHQHQQHPTVKSPVKTSPAPVSRPGPSQASSAAVSSTGANHPPVPINRMTPGLAGGMQPTNQTPPHVPSVINNLPNRNFNPNNPVNPATPVSSSGADDHMKNSIPPNVQNPYAIHKPNYPMSMNPHQKSFEMQQQNFPPGNFGDYPNYNHPYMNYMENHQSQMYGGPPYSHAQHMAAFRPGLPHGHMSHRPQMPPGYMGNRIPDPRFSPNSPMQDHDVMSGGMSPHLAGMGMGMPPHMNPGMGRPHPGMMGTMGMSTSHHPVGPYPNSHVNTMTSMSPKPHTVSMAQSMSSSGQMINSPVISPHSGMMPGTMSPQSYPSDRQLVGPPSMSPMSDRGPMYPSQYRMSSPKYNPAQQAAGPNFSHSPTYPGSQNYQRPPTPQGYKPPTPQSYTKPPTPQSTQNPTTPGSYHNPSTPGPYQNPTTPLSQQNPLTPQPYDTPTADGSQGSSQLNSQLNSSFEGGNNSQGSSSSQLNSSFDGNNSNPQQPVAQTNPHSSSFIVPKNESVIQSPVPNIFKDNSKIMTPMLSPPSTTSSLRKIRRPSKSVTPGTVSPNQKSLSPNQIKEPTVKAESDTIVPKKEPLSSPPSTPVKAEPTVVVKKEQVDSPKSEPENSSSPVEDKPLVEPKAEPVEKPPSPPPPRVKTPVPVKDPRWGEDGPDGMPEKVLKKIFTYVCYTDGCLPFLPNAMLVCKLWNSVASNQSLWTHANLGSAVKEKMRSEKKLEWILKNKFPNAIDVDVTGWKAVMSAPALKIIAATCPKLTGLGLSNCVKLNYEDIRIVPSLFPNLERIDLSLVSPSTASSRSAVSSSALSDLITSLGEKLTHFNMSSNKMAGLPFVFKALSQHSKNLIFLDVSNISTTSRDTILINIEKLQKGCPKLKVFRTTNTMLGLNETPVREQVMAPGFPHLEEITIGVDQRGYFDGMDDGQIERILKKSNKLKLLDIRGCKGIIDSTLVRLPCWDLEYLYVAGCSVTSSSRDGLELLVKKWCSSLIELDIGLTSDVKTVDWAVMALVENSDIIRLRKLNLNGTGVSLKPLTKLLNCCETLCSLNLSACRALPRGMKRMYHTREDVVSLVQGINEGKFNDAGSEEDD